MLQRIIEWVIEQRWLVLTLAALGTLAGVVSLSRLPFDAFPDTTPVIVQVNTVPPGFAPEDVESQVTAVLERELSGIPNLVEVRSISKFGLSQITCVFRDGTDIYLARQQISERLATLDLPAGVERPRLGPISTGLGEIYHYIVVDTLAARRDPNSPHYEPTLAREVQDWVIKPQLQTVPGVVEVNSWGGFEKQFQVLLYPQRLTSFDITLQQVTEALKSGNANVGGGATVRAGEQILVQGVGAITKREEIEQIVVASRNGIPLRIRDLADVVIGHELRVASATYNGNGEAVLGLGFMLTGENSHRVASDLSKQLEAAKKTLPPGIDAHVVYDRTHLVDQVLETVKHNLLFGAALVIAVLLAFLGNLRASLIVALAIPLSMMFAFNLMLQAGVVGSLMSLGAIDFGLAVDNAVIQVENVTRRLGEGGDKKDRFAVIRDAILEVRKPTLFGELIIMLVYLPILTLQGVEGKLFQPMALTVMFVLAGSLLLSFTVIPALCAVFLPLTVQEHEPKIVDKLRTLYQPVLNFALRKTRLILAGAVALVMAAVLILTRMGSEFVPRLSEGSVVVNLIRLAGISLDQSSANGTQIEKLLKEKFPHEVAEVWTRTGTPELATDPMGIELSDVFVTLKPRAEWTKANHQQELVALMDEELSDLPGMNRVFTQPIEMRFNEMIAGIRADVGIKIFGDNFDILGQKAEAIEKIVSETRGAADVNVEQITGQPVLRLEIDRNELARYSLSSADVLQAVEAVGGIPVGEVREGQRRFDLALKLNLNRAGETMRPPTPEALDNVILPAPGGELVPLATVAKFNQIESASTISHEWGKRRIIVQCNVRGRDTGSFVNELRARIEKEVPLEPGYYVRFGGQFENLERARIRLLLVVPLALLLIFGLLYWTYKSARDALLIFSGVPLAAAGGVFVLALRGMPFTISAAVGFIALSGIAVLNGLVLVSSIRNLQEEGVAFADAIRTSGALRMRPVFMTALVAALGFIPMMISTGVGAEVQRPLASVVVGGIITSTLLTLIVLPVLYARFGKAVRGATAQ
jgi:cobalt-zinc-cadmium resistance protein CzcA